MDRARLLTERRNPRSMTLDTMDAASIVALMNEEDRVAVEAVAAVRADVARAADLIADRLARGGRLIYAGAGTSGRLGVLDASECPPTFRSDPSQVIGLIAGGEAAMFRAKEGAEDSADDGAAAVAGQDAGEQDVVCGIAAGGTTPFVYGALAEARRRTAATIFVTCVEPFPAQPPADVAIHALVGPEVLTGSTRLKAGTATKLICNQLTTVAFVRLGKCYENLMVDVKATNAKLRDRAARIVATICGVPVDDATTLLHAADGHVKTAVVLHRHACDAATALARLDAANGNLRAAIGTSAGRPAVPSPGTPGEG